MCKILLTQTSANQFGAVRATVGIPTRKKPGKTTQTIPTKQLGKRWKRCKNWNPKWKSVEEPPRGAEVGISIGKSLEKTTQHIRKDEKLFSTSAKHDSNPQPRRRKKM
jgi:hypothetical protein